MNLKHFDHDGRVRFVTFCTHDRLPLLTNWFSRNIVINELDQSRQANRFKLLAYVIMPEHIHLVFLPRIEEDVGRMIGKLKLDISTQLLTPLIDSRHPLASKLTVTRNGLHRRVFWQRRCFDHNCRNEKSIFAKMNYCHRNPVTRGLVINAEDWIWSSCRFYMGLDNILLAMDSLA